MPQRPGASDAEMAICDSAMESVVRRIVERALPDVAPLVLDALILPVVGALISFVARRGAASTAPAPVPWAAPSA